MKFFNANNTHYTVVLLYLLNGSGAVVSSGFYRYILIFVKVDASVGPTKQLPGNNTSYKPSTLEIVAYPPLHTLISW